MKKVAVPVTQGLLSEYFGQCNHYEVFLIDNGIVRSEEIEMPSGKNVANMLEWAKSTGITDIIAHRIDKNLINLFLPQRISIFVGIPIAPPKSLIEDYLNGNLKSNQQIISEITE
jgi:hypothetical protein